MLAGESRMRMQAAELAALKAGSRELESELAAAQVRVGERGGQVASAYDLAVVATAALEFCRPLMHFRATERPN